MQELRRKIEGLAVFPADYSGIVRSEKYAPRESAYAGGSQGTGMRYYFIIALLCIICYSAAEADMAVSVGRPFCTEIGASVDVDIYLVNTDSVTETGGFDLLLSFDTCLTLESVTMGDLLVSCGWEYFTHRLEDQNRIRLITMADISNGPVHPSCYADTSGVLATMTFTVAEEPPEGYDFLRIEWVWYDCGDNVLSSVSGDTLFISHDVYEFDGINETQITNDTASFPTFGGAPDACLPNPRAIDFYGGGIHMIGEDTIPPTALCPGDTVTGADSGYCGAVVQYSAEVTDNYPGATISCLPQSGWHFSRGTTLVTCIATDVMGNEDTCFFDITVIDDVPPTPHCPGDMVVDNDSGACTAAVAYTAEVTDNCPGATISCDFPSASAFPIGTTIVTCAALDIGGNVVDCDFQVTVNDIEPPVLHLPDEIIVAGDSESCGTAVSYDVTVTDTCSAATVSCSPVSGSFFPIGTDSVVCIGIDDYGNADSGAFTVTVVDTQPPVMDLPEGLTATTDPGLCGAYLPYQVSVVDDCGDASIACTPASGSYFPSGLSTVRCIAVDDAGNADTAEFSLTVIDSQPPAILPHADTAAGNDPGRCGAIIEYDVPAADNCPGLTLICSPPSGDLFPVGFSSVQCIAIDGAELADTMSFEVLISDTSRPILECPDDMSVLNDSGFYGAVVDFAADAADNCPGVTVQSSPLSGSYFNTGSTAIRITATDAVGNATVCQFVVTVELNDPDGDGVPDWDDNCADDYNPMQLDGDGDGIGDICDWRYGDANRDDDINVSDAVYVVEYVFTNGPPPDPAESGDANCDGVVNIADAVYLINYVFTGGPEPSCP